MNAAWETEINHEETKDTKKDLKNIFAPFVSSWLISVRAGDPDHNFSKLRVIANHSNQYRER